MYLTCLYRLDTSNVHATCTFIGCKLSNLPIQGSTKDPFLGCVISFPYNRKKLFNNKIAVLMYRDRRQDVVQETEGK